MRMEKEADPHRRFFDRHAEGWEERNYSPEKLLRVERMLSRLEWRDGMTILDAGCGQGVLLPFLRALAGESARLIALDASLPMLRGVAARSPKTWALHARAESIPLIDAYVDVAVCFSAFPHFSDKEAAAREFYRVLKPEGLVHVLHIDGRETLNGLHDRHHEVRGDHLPCAHGMRKIFGQAGFSDMALDESADHYYFSAKKP